MQNNYPKEFWNQINSLQSTKVKGYQLSPEDFLMCAVDKHRDIQNTCINITHIPNSEKKDWTIEI